MPLGCSTHGLCSVQRRFRSRSGDLLLFHGSCRQPGSWTQQEATSESLGSHHGCQSLQNYAALIRQQINEDKQKSREKTVFGIQLTEEKLNDFRDEQIGQLKELMDEATKPHKKITVSKDSEHKS
uniref:Succinate dehydrogenase assembly factor 3 n=1 Tax=Anser brachyrhynchus TaxID=132585 RepID=A0A8B9BGF2_9AVES